MKELIDNGILVSDDITFEVLKSHLGRDEYKKGFVLDGYPRNIRQAKLLDNITSIDFIINLKLSDEIVIERISNRRTCTECGEMFNLITKPPQKEGICDKCGGELYQREDDNPEAIKKRLSVYREETEPLIQYYSEKGLLKEVDGNQEMEKIFGDIVEILSK